MGRAFRRGRYRSPQNHGANRPTRGGAGETGEDGEDAADGGPARPADQADTRRVKIKSRRDNHQSTRMIPSQAISSVSIATSLDEALSEGPIHLLGQPKMNS